MTVRITKPEINLREKLTELGVTPQNSKLYFGEDLKLNTIDSGIDVTGIITADGLTVGGDITFSDSDDLILPDDSKIILGDGSDLEIYHNGSNSYIDDNGTGSLFIRASNLNLQSSGGTDTYITAAANGAVAIRYDGSQKLATTSTGVDVTGDIAASGEAHADSDFFTDDVPMRARTFAMSMMYGI